MVWAEDKQVEAEVQIMGLLVGLDLLLSVEAGDWKFGGEL